MTMHDLLPFQIGPLLAVGLILLVGSLSGELAKRLRLPSVTGQIIMGVILGPSALGMFSTETLHGLQPITHFALGLMTMAIGSHLNLQRLRNTIKRLSILVVCEALLTPLVVFLGVLVAAEGNWPLGLLIAAMSVATAPATIIAIIKETRSKGVFVKTLVGAVALNNMACITLFAAAYAIARARLDPNAEHTLLNIIAAPFRELLATLVLGGGAGVLLVLLTRRVRRTDVLSTASLGVLLLTSGFADALGISSMLSCMFLGIVLANLAPTKQEIGHAVFDNFETSILAVFFTLAGMELNFAYVVPAGFLALMVAGTRGFGKILSARLAMYWAGATERVRRYLGMALIPQAGVAVGLVLLVQEDPIFQPVSQMFLAVGLTVVTINEVVGPILTRAALARSGDLGQDRSRLIDFLHEENIIVDMEAETKKEAIAHLTDLLIRSNHLNVNREELLQSILNREQESSTCIGNGLAIPHGTLHKGESISGVMGLSRKGLAFDTPDGTPIHCVVLLATPPSKRDHHLKVLAALARSVGADKNIQQQLFNAKSSAHAYEILHAKESEDYNYFLDGD